MNSIIKIKFHLVICSVLNFYKITHPVRGGAINSNSTIQIQFHLMICSVYIFIKVLKKIDDKKNYTLDSFISLLL